MLTRRETLGLFPLMALVGCAPRPQPAGFVGGDWSADAHDGVRLPVRGLARPVRLTVLADTHLALRDARDEAYAAHCARMSRWPGEAAIVPTVLKRVKDAGTDLLLLLGDNISFPTFANVEFLKRELDRCGLPWAYVAGNHDWHFEGDEGSDFEQRARWIERRLGPLYQGRDPLMSSVSVGGVRIVLIDNSLYHVTPEQLAFFKAELARGEPTVLALHIPLWQPGWGVSTCACPTWGAATDANWRIERRERWAERLMPSTYAFREAAFAATNLVTVLSGHIHRFQVAACRGRPFVTAPGNQKGDILQVMLLPTW